MPATDLQGETQMYPSDELELWKRSFDYNPATGALVWKSNKRSDLIGKEAGYLDKFGYRQVACGQRMRKAHRVAWSIYHDQMVPPGMQIDHINHNPSDNRIEHLRAVTPSANQRNKALDPRNKTGAPGVFLDKRRNLWYVRINNGGSYVVRGAFKTADEAIACRNELNPQYGFHQNHGAIRAGASNV